MNASRTPRRLYPVLAFLAVWAGLAVWWWQSGSRTAGVLIWAELWLFSLLFDRRSGLLYWLLLVVATVPVVVWGLGYGGIGLPVVSVVLLAFATAARRWHEAAHGSA